MSKIKTRLDKLTGADSHVSLVIIYESDEDIKSKVEKLSGVVVLLPNNHREEDSYER